MTLSQEDHFILSKVISGVEVEIEKWPAMTCDYELNGPKEEILGYLAGLRDVVNELAGLKE